MLTAKQEVLDFIEQLSNDVSMELKDEIDSWS